MKKSFLSFCCLLAVVSCGQKQGKTAASSETDSISRAELAQIETDGKSDHVLTLLQLFHKQHKTDVGTEALKVVDGQWGTKQPKAEDMGWVRYLNDYWVVEAYIDSDTKAETMRINMLGEDTGESLELQALPKKDGAWWCFVAYHPNEDYPKYYSYELRDGMLKPAKSPLDTYKKSHESMDAWVMLDHFGTGIDIDESFMATYTLRVRQHFNWDGEKFTLSQITPNDGLTEEYKACKQAWDNEEFHFDKFALVPAGGTLGLLVSSNDEEQQALFNLGPYDTEDAVQMLQGCHRAFGLFSLKFFEHGTVAEQSCGSGCRTVTYTLMEHWTMKHQLKFNVAFDDYDEATDTYHVTGDVSYELDGKDLSEGEGEQMRRQIVSELGKQVEVKPKWIKIGKQ